MLAISAVIALLYLFCTDPPDDDGRPAPMKAFLERHWKLAVLFAIGVAGWWLVARVSGDVYALAIGPDAIAKALMAPVNACVAVWLARKIVKWRFPTIYEFTTIAPGRTETEFTRIWKQPGGFSDRRLSMAVAVHLGVFIGICLLMPG